MTDKLIEAAQQADPDPADIIAGALQTSRSHAYELMHKALAQQDAQAVPQPSPTAGMNIAQRILHVGGRNNAAGYVEFGSIQAVEALVRQVIRDLPELVELENLRHNVKVYREATALTLNADPTPPAQRVMLTDLEIKAVLVGIDPETKRLPPGFRNFAYSIIEAYEKKNGIK